MSDDSASAGEFEFDLAVSFAGEDSAYVEQVVSRLRAHGVRMFYAPQSQAALWGKDLVVEFSEIFSRRSRRVMMFVSQHYVRKFWPQTEAAASYAGQFRQHQRIILPVRLDDTEVPGLLPTISYINGRKYSPLDVANEAITVLKDLGVAVGAPQRAPSSSSVLATTPLEDQELVVEVHDEVGPVHGADILVLYPNNVALSHRTDQKGVVRFRLHTGGGLTLYAAESSHRAALHVNFTASHSLHVFLPRMEGGGSAVISGGAGHISAIVGRLNPILDTANRTYLYADNVAVEGGRQQPVTFVVGEPLRLTDINNRSVLLTVRDIRGRSALVEWRESH